MKIRRYILILLFINIVGIGLFFSLHFELSKRLNEINDKLYNLQTKKYIALDIDESILKLQALFMRLPLSFYKRTLDEINIKIANEIANIKQNLNILKNGGIYRKKVYLNIRGKEVLKQEIKFPKSKISIENITLLPKLIVLEKKLKELNKLIEERNNLLYKKDKNFLYKLKKIKRKIRTLPSIFDRMIENSNRVLYSTDIELRKLKKELNYKRKLYYKIEIIFISIVILIIMIIVFITIGNIVKLYKELKYRLYYDHLTGLKNRIALEEEITNKEGILLLIDINDFKNINELYGINIGNEVLIKFSQTLSQFLKNKDGNIYRISGDVFALYFFEKINVKDFISQFRNKLIDTPIFINEINDILELDIKVGVGSGDELLEKATIALDYVKEKNLQYYELAEKIVENRKDIKFAIEWQKKIRDGLKKDKFIPFFQPIVDKNENIIKYESLMRLEMEVNGEIKYIPPFYLDTAIKTRQYNTLSRTIIKKVFEKILSNNNMEVTMNLNYLDIIDKEMNELIFSLLEKHKDIGKRITFEMLEDEGIEDYELVKEFIKKFKSYGAKLAIDDFGSGYSNFQQVLELDPDFIKIDATLIKNINKDRASYVIVESMVHYAKEFNIKIIAEYIHNKEVFEVCKKLGVDYFQGFYISKPLKDV